MFKHSYKKYTPLLITIVCVSFFAPIVLFAAWSPGSDSLIPCKGVSEDTEGNLVTTCSFADIVRLVKNIINFIIYMAPFVASIIFAWAGFTYVTAGGDQGKIKEAHKMFSSVAVGLILILSAWLIVKMILVGLGAESWATPLNI